MELGLPKTPSHKLLLESGTNAITEWAASPLWWSQVVSWPLNQRCNFTSRVPIQTAPSRSAATDSANPNDRLVRAGTHSELIFVTSNPFCETPQSVPVRS